MSWQNAGKLTAKHCEIHSHPCESGVLVGEADTVLDGCRIYGNGAAGVVSQQKGNLRAVNGEVHDNCEGILIQDTGSAHVEKCKVDSNRSNGIFVGFDHGGSAAIIDNEAYDNRHRGVLIANSRNIVSRGNIESGNLGLPPQLPTKFNPAAFALSEKYLKRSTKSNASIKKAAQESQPVSFFDSILKTGYEQGTHEKMLGDLKTILERCSYCKAEPSKDKSFARCSRCRNVSYFSPKCQKTHWSEHKKACQDKSVKYPSFLDRNVST